MFSGWVGPDDESMQKSKKKEEKETEQIRGEIKRNEQMANKNEDVSSAMDTRPILTIPGE